VPRKTPAPKALPSPDDWHFLSNDEAAARFGCGGDTMKAMVKFNGAGVLPSFPVIGLQKRICPELVKRWLLEMASTENGREVLASIKADNRQSLE
jgi:hypothetical protein